MTARGRQLAAFAPTPDEDGDQLDMIEAAGLEPLGPGTIRGVIAGRGHWSACPLDCDDDACRTV